MDLYILHAGISHPSPYFYNLKQALKSYPEINVIINPELPTTSPKNKGVIYFNRLKRFYDCNDLSSVNKFLIKIDELKKLGWKIVWSIHGFFPIDHNLTEVDEYIVKKFINKCDLLFTLSKYLQSSIRENYGKDSTYHSMGINKLDGYFDNFSIDLKEIPSDAILFSFVGNIYSYKLLNIIVEKFNDLINNKKIYLLIAGPKVNNHKVSLNIKNPNIIVKEGFIGDTSWEKIAEKTNCFICLYDLELPSFKYGMFPSNIVKIQSLKKVCITPDSPMINELANSASLITYNPLLVNNFGEKIDYVVNNVEKIKKIENSIIPKKYSWDETAKIFVEGLRKLYE